MTYSSKKIKTSAKIKPKIIRPKLSAEEKRQNAAHRSSIRYIRMLKKGYRAYNVWLPDPIRKEVQGVIRMMIQEHEEKQGEENV